MTTFTPTHDVVTEATAAGFFPPRHNVEITQVTELTDRVMRLTFRDPFIASHAKPAQFVNLFTHDDFMLMPRPFGVSEVDGDEVSVIFAVVGHGTEQLAGLQAGDTVDVLGPLGRGFNLKWNMGWMNDMCHYLKLDPWFRQFHHKDITFSLMYAFSENFVLPISHDEVVHMKGSLRGKMPGDDWQQLAGVRAFTAYLLAHPGKKLTFMGAELGQWHEWNFASQLDWYLLENKENQQTQRFFKDINRFYLSQSPLWDIDFSWEGFEWLVADDNHNNVVVFVRRDRKGRELIAAVNFSPVGRADYRFGVPPKKTYREVFTTDLPAYGGTGDWRNEGELLTESIPSHGKPCSLCVTIPPLGAVFFAGEGEWQEEEKTNEPPEV